MIYLVNHVTTYDYTSSVSRSQHVLRLRPRDTPTQRCEHNTITIAPEPSEGSSHTDFFGNHTLYANVDEPHNKLVVTAASRINVDTDLRLMPNPGPKWEQVRDQLPTDRSPEGIDAYQYVFDSPLVPVSDPMRQFALRSFTPGRPMLEATEGLSQRIYTQFKYDPSATTISTPIEQVLAQRAGVCQDFAHLMIGCLRSLGLAARYMSGYIRPDNGSEPSGADELRGVGASHAWLAVYLHDLGWIEFDPTNNAMPGRLRTDHITLAWGRDYTDVAPVEGVTLGGGQHSFTVAVDVHHA